MAQCKYASTKQTTNAARLSRVVIDVFTDLFREILKLHITEIQFPFVLQEKRDKLCAILNKNQKEYLYPVKDLFTGTYKEFDLSLLYILIRNVSGIPSHQHGWGKTPKPRDRSVSANIDRVREIRNKNCGHSGSASLDDGDFHRLWQELRFIIGEIEAALKLTTYTDAINFLENETMDPEQQEMYLSIIDDQQVTISDVKGTQDILMKEQKRQNQEIEKQGEKLCRLERQNAILPEARNILVNTANVLRTHRLSETYTVTSAVQGTIEKLRKYKLSVLVGYGGEGKTTTAYEVMCHMLENSTENPLTPVEIKYPEEWNKVVNAYGNFIVFLDDFMGSFNLDTDAMEKWKNHVNFIFPSIKGRNIYLMFGIRKNVMEAAKNRYQVHELFKEKYIIDFSKEFALSEKEKLAMLEAFEKKYINRNTSLQGKEMNGHQKENVTEKMSQLSDLDKKKIVQSNPFYGFPLTCFQFFTIRGCYELGPAFFLRPNRELFTRIENMRTSNDIYEKIRYTVLSYIFVHGSICLQNFDIALYETVCVKVRLQNIREIEIQDAIHSMDGSFLSESSIKGKYMFSHDTILETILVSYGQLAPDVVIKICSRQKLQELLRTENCEMKQHEVALKIKKANFSDLCQIMLYGDDADDIISDPFLAARNIAWHPASTDPNFVTHLLHFDASERLIDVISNLVKVLPFCPQKEPTLLFMLLEDFGPHITNLEESKKPTITDVTILKLVLEIVQFACDKEKYILCILRYVQKYRNFENLVDAKIGGQSFHTLSLFHYCVLHGWSNAVDFILQYKNPIKTGENWSCAHLAAYAGRFELLCKFEALDQNIERLDRTNEGYTVLQTAMFGLRYGHGEVYKPSYSMNTGAIYSFHFNIVFPGEESFKNVLIFVLQVGDTKTTPNDVEICVDDIPDKNAVTHALVNNSQYVTDRLTCYCDPTKKSGNNIVFYLTIHNYADILVLLLKENRGIALYRNENELPTSLHLASYLGRCKILKILLECGVFVQTPDLEMSLLEALRSGEKLSGRTLQYDMIKHETDWKSCWNDGENEVLDFKLKSFTFVKIRFGNACDFRDTSDYIRRNREFGSLKTSSVHKELERV